MYVDIKIEEAPRVMKKNKKNKNKKDLVLGVSVRSLL